MSKIVLFVVFSIVSPLLMVNSAESNPFKHPGVLVSKSMLDLVKTKIKAGAEPWKTGYKHMFEFISHEHNKTANYSSLSFNPNPRKVVECGSSSIPDYGCWDEMWSSQSAYTHALIWYYTGNISHANKSIEIMDAWASIIEHHTSANAPLQAGWVGSVWPRAGEIIKHTNASWSEEKQKRFADMLRKVYLPVVHNGINSNTNWHLTLLEATVGISVYLEDHETFDHALSLWRKRLPAMIYLKTDGAHPLSDPTFKLRTGDDLIHYWYNQTHYVDGITQETCRDFGHTSMGLAALINTAETAWHQGIDLYKEAQERIVKAMEFHANYLIGAPIPEWLCGGKIKHGIDELFTWEIGYNHYHNRLHVEMPKTNELITKKYRPTGAKLHMNWETLTHAENPNN